jgi:hypothetical protein
MVVRLSALRTGRALLPRNIILLCFRYFCKGLSEPHGLLRPEGSGKFKISPYQVSNPPPSGL